MSAIYISEPPTLGKVVLHTTHGSIDIELWPREAPKAVRNFVQLCMEGYYDDTIFHRIIKGFMIQGGDPLGTGFGGESTYGAPFVDEFHSRLRFSHRGVVAMANDGPNANGSQFFVTLDKCEWLQKKHTIFGKVSGDTIFNVMNMGEVEVGENDMPVAPPKILRTEVLLSPFEDIVPRDVVHAHTPKARQLAAAAEEAARKQSLKNQKKNTSLLSFVDDELEETEAVVPKSKKASSVHDLVEDDPRLVSTSKSAQELAQLARSKLTKSDSSAQQAVADRLKSSSGTSSSSGPQKQSSLSSSSASSSSASLSASSSSRPRSRSPHKSSSSSSSSSRRNRSSQSRSHSRSRSRSTSRSRSRSRSRERSSRYRRGDHDDDDDAERDDMDAEFDKFARKGDKKKKDKKSKSKRDSSDDDGDQNVDENDAPSVAAARRAALEEKKLAQNKIKIMKGEGRSRDEELMTEIESRRAKFMKRNKLAKGRESQTMEKLARFTSLLKSADPQAKDKDAAASADVNEDDDSGWLTHHVHFVHRPQDFDPMARNQDRYEYQTFDPLKAKNAPAVMQPTSSTSSSSPPSSSSSSSSSSNYRERDRERDRDHRDRDRDRDYRDRDRGRDHHHRR